MATLEEAQCCPKCGFPGEETSTSPVPSRPGDVVHHMKCDNNRCKWYNTGWIFQVKKDGSIPERKPGPKQFEPMSKFAETSARDEIAAVEDLQRRGLI